MDTSILIVDDEQEIRDSLSEVLTDEGFLTYTAENGAVALEMMKDIHYDIIISDIKMPELDGVTLLQKVKEQAPDTFVILVTSYGSTETAINAMRLGAIDYILKPIDFDELILRIKNIDLHKELLREVRFLRQEISAKYNYEHIIGESIAMKKMYRLIDKVAPSTSTVLVAGRSGTGKELVARAIHARSERAHRPFVAINCGAIPETLFESELFGYKKGAFTGASRDKDGVFKAAAGGTLFLDEVGEIPLQVQVKLLRVIEMREIKPLGSNTIIPINVRLIAATNRDLAKEVERGTFREDLYYRLNIIEIYLPALSERKDDIPLLVTHFVNKYNNELKRRIIGVDNEAMKSLVNYNWKGEVRELENIVERAVLLSDGDMISTEDLPSRTAESSGSGYPDNLKEASRSFERKHIVHMLEKCESDKAKVADILGIGLSSLYRKIDDLGIDSESE
ncbi:MAG: sigma-54-dependent Fis family transcriptional regulator [FCB group bacterium]|nr:sigma-54-dependent Fis family transcriptional regulator [FCB group bacterium]MBL7026938.1 sigma-54-dependent Fis family transcriptional regulator [Candidatus Neomarinimicrobiota bacterium]MBL7120445.1 sigma-54-dependent Fis family transcriptional regulator [Candidatus Neomarinimicrobiota bacterium]